MGVQELKEQSGGRSQREAGGTMGRGRQGSLYDLYGFHSLLISHQCIHFLHFALTLPFLEHSSSSSCSCSYKTQLDSLFL